MAPENAGIVTPFLADGAQTHDLQGPVQFFFDTLFAGLTVLDYGAGLGRSKARIRHNRVTTFDADARLRDHCDIVGDFPLGVWDAVTAFDVIEHVRDDSDLLGVFDQRSRRTVFLSTPNWHVHRCESGRHYREYTGEELRTVSMRIWSQDCLRMFAMFKDAEGAWFDLVPWDSWDEHRGVKHCLLVLKDEEDRGRIDRFHARREWRP